MAVPGLYTNKKFGYKTIKNNQVNKCGCTTIDRQKYIKISSDKAFIYLIFVLVLYVNLYCYICSQINIFNKY